MSGARTAVGIVVLVVGVVFVGALVLGSLGFRAAKVREAERQALDARRIAQSVAQEALQDNAQVATRQNAAQGEQLPEGLVVDTPEDWTSGRLLRDPRTDWVVFQDEDLDWMLLREGPAMAGLGSPLPVPGDDGVWLVRRGERQSLMVPPVQRSVLIVLRQDGEESRLSEIRRPKGSSREGFLAAPRKIRAMVEEWLDEAGRRP